MIPFAKRVKANSIKWRIFIAFTAIIIGIALLFVVLHFVAKNEKQSNHHRYHRDSNKLHQSFTLTMTMNKKFDLDSFQYKDEEQTYEFNSGQHFFFQTNHYGQKHSNLIFQIGNNTKIECKLCRGTITGKFDVLIDGISVLNHGECYSFQIDQPNLYKLPITVRTTANGLVDLWFNFFAWDADKVERRLQFNEMLKWSSTNAHGWKSIAIRNWNLCRRAVRYSTVPFYWQEEILNFLVVDKERLDANEVMEYLSAWIQTIMAGGTYQFPFLLNNIDGIMFEGDRGEDWGAISQDAMKLVIESTSSYYASIHKQDHTNYLR